MSMKMFKKLFTAILIFLILFLMLYFLLDSSIFVRKISNYTVVHEKFDNSKLINHYGVIIDAGSSGSRLFIYTWPTHTGNSGELLRIQPLLDETGKPIVKKVNPGLSSLADQPDKAMSYIKPLLDLAANSVPKSLHNETPFYLMATAGMRMIPLEAQNAILKNIREFVKKEYKFLFSDSHAKVITGQEEGIFGWITTNYLLGRFNHNHSDGVPIIPVHFIDSSFRSEQVHHRKRTVGVIDMGGGSMQIAYELEPNSAKDIDSAVTFNLGCRENDADHTYRVFVTTFLGFGANSARTRYERMLVREHVGIDRNFTEINKNTTEPMEIVIEEPCLQKGSKVTQKVKLVNDTQGGLGLSSKEIKKLPSIKATFQGNGKYHSCEARLLSVLNKIPCPTESNLKSTCTMSGRLHPKIDLASTQFYGFSEFWYSTEDVLGLGGQYNYFKLHSASVDHCKKDWTSLSIDYKKGLFKNADWSRMKYQCFKAAWITAVLHNGLGFPNAFNKFTSVQEINGAEVQWSLGALLYQTRYFPLRVIEQKEQDRKKQAREVRNKPKNIYMYLFLFMAASVVMVTVYWMHNRDKWKIFPSVTSYRKNSSNFDTHSSDVLFTKIELAHSSGSIKDFRSSPNFKHWIQ